MPGGFPRRDGATQRGSVTLGTLTPAAVFAAEDDAVPGGRRSEDKGQSLILGI